MAGEKCHFCGKTVYAAELRRYDGMVFHALCHGKWKKQQEAADSAKRNIEYGKKPDVSPAYYRVGDPATGQAARMVSGEEERAEFAAEQRTEVAPLANVSPSAVAAAEKAAAAPAEAAPAPAEAPCGTVCGCGNQLPAGAKFCCECGAKVEAKPAGCPKCGFADAKGKFCSECGASL